MGPDRPLEKFFYEKESFKGKWSRFTGTSYKEDVIYLHTNYGIRGKIVKSILGNCGLAGLYGANAFLYNEEGLKAVLSLNPCERLLFDCFNASKVEELCKKLEVPILSKMTYPSRYGSSSGTLTMFIIETKSFRNKWLVEPKPPEVPKESLKPAQ